MATKHMTIFCKIGRAEPQPLASFNAANETDAEISCDAVQAAKVAEFLRAGVSLDRVKFERETVEIEDEPEDTKAQPRKTKGKR